MILDRPIAVIDIGSNSVHLMLLQPVPDGLPRLVRKVKDYVRLRAAIDDSGALSEEAISRAALVIAEFRRIADDADAEVRAVATAAVRGARNRRHFVERIRDDAGVEVEVIDGRREAALVYQGVRLGMPGFDGAQLCADVGGGSTEVLHGRGDEVQAIASVDIGAVGLTRDRLGDVPVSAVRLETTRVWLREALARVVLPFDGLAPERWIATSGTIQRLARMHVAATGLDPDTPIDGITIDRLALDALVDALAAADTTEARLRLPGIDPDRADILLGGALVFEALADVFAIPAWTVSMAGLRMGLAAEVLRRRRARAA